MAGESAQIGMSLSGVDDLLRSLDQLGQFGKKSALQAAMKKGAVPIADAMRRLAPRSGDGKGKPLADTIVIRTTLSSSQKRKRGGRRAEAEVFVGPTAPHAHLVEFGHLIVKSTGVPRPTTRIGRKVEAQAFKKTGRSNQRAVVGHAPAYPFARPAYDAEKENAVRITGRELHAEMIRVVRRYARQFERGKPSRGAREFKMSLGL